MTGFGAASRAWPRPEAPLRIDVEIRSVNARFLELKIRQPFGPRIEAQLRPLVEARLGRGRVDLAVHVRREMARETEVDALGSFGLEAGRVREAARLFAQAERIAAEESLQLRPSTSAELLRFLLASARAPTSSEAPVEPPAFLDELVSDAVDEMVAFREREGRALHLAIEALADELAASVHALAATLPDEQERLLQRWTERVEEVCARTGAADVDRERVAQEVVVLVARGDVAEELARIHSHLGQLRGVLAADATAGQGKTLDFVSQELLREITTIGSKITSHAGSRIVIDAKGTIERIREQVHNAE